MYMTNVLQTPRRLRPAALRWLSLVIFTLRHTGDFAVRQKKLFGRGAA